MIMHLISMSYVPSAASGFITVSVHDDMFSINTVALWSSSLWGLCGSIVWCSSLTTQDASWFRWWRWVTHIPEQQYCLSERLWSLHCWWIYSQLIDMNTESCAAVEFTPKSINTYGQRLSLLVYMYREIPFSYSLPLVLHTWVCPLYIYRNI